MTASEVRIRPASLGDAATIADVGARAFRAAYGPHANRDDIEAQIRDYFSVAAVRSALEQQGQRYLLASVGGLPGGIAKFRQAPCPLPGGDENACELQQLYVLAEKQGHGLGRRLVDAVTDIARQDGARGIWLSAWEFADWAIGFYKNIGFTALGTVEFRLGTTVHNDRLMWLPLRAAPG